MQKLNEPAISPVWMNRTENLTLHRSLPQTEYHLRLTVLGIPGSGKKALLKCFDPNISFSNSKSKYALFREEFKPLSRRFYHSHCRPPKQTDRATRDSNFRPFGGRRPRCNFELRCFFTGLFYSGRRGHLRQRLES